MKHVHFDDASDNHQRGKESTCPTASQNNFNAPIITSVAGGTFGTVYGGTLDTKVVAIKVLPSINPSEMNKTKALTKELATWQDVQHPNIAPMQMMYASTNELPSFVSPWYENGNLQEYTEKNPEIDRMKLLSDVALGLEYLHENNLVHGDIRPANVMIDDNQVAVLTDFGFSEIRDLADDSFLQETTGRPCYMAPEICQEQNEYRYTQQTDVWSYGCLSIAIMENTSPYSNIPDAVGIVLAQYSHVHPFQHLHYNLRDASHVPAHNWHLMIQCLSFNPKNRPDIRQFQTHTGSAETKLAGDAANKGDYSQANSKDWTAFIITRSRL